jgi:PAS domain S-box-containing protein
VNAVRSQSVENGDGADSWPADRRSSDPGRRMLLFVGLLAFIVGSMVLVTWQASAALSSVRAYVAGEALWSKAQKEAVISLMRYASSGNPADHEDYERAIAVPLADRDARIELEKPEPDLHAVHESFIAGRNHPSDVEKLTRLFLRFRNVSYMAQAIEIWEEGDGRIAELQTLAASLHEEIASGSPDPARVRAVLDELGQVDARLTALEDRFSATLGEAARRLQALIVQISLVSAGAFLLLGTFVLARVMRRIRSTEEDLRKNEYEYRQLRELASDGIFITDADGNHLVVNRRAGEMLGYDTAELSQMNFREIVDPEDLARTPLRFGQLRLGKSMLVERVLRRREGSTLDVEISAKMLPDGRMQGLVRDVSERKKAERALHEREEQLRQSQKMEAVGQLAGGVAHDFNNLLTAILGHGQQLLRAVDGDARLRRNAEEITRAARRAADLTRQLLAFSRRQFLEPTLVDVNSLVDETHKMLRRVIGEHIELELRKASNLGCVRADRGQIEQVLLNLAINARDAMPDGGRLTIETRMLEVEVSGDAPDPAVPPGCYVMLVVSDSGEGMDPATRERVFEPFFTTKEMGKGTGLGLSTVYGIIKQSGGYVYLDSDPGEGTTIRIYLSRTRPDDAPHETPVKRETSERASGTILVVEDEELLRDLVQEVLEDLGYQVLLAQDGQDAVRVAETHRGELDLLVTDIVMPGMNGREVAQKLSADRDGLRVLFVSGYTDEEVIRRGELQPGSLFLKKPFTPDSLAAKVRQALRARMEA